MEGAAALACISRYLEFIFKLGVRGNGMHMLLARLHAKGIDPEMWVPAPENFSKYIVSSTGEVVNRLRLWKRLKQNCKRSYRRIGLTS